MVDPQVKNEEEKLAFLDRLHAGDPVVWGRLIILEHQQELEREREEEEDNCEIPYIWH